MEDASSTRPDVYRLDQLGWLQFERLASLVLEAEGGLCDLHWHDRADRGRKAWVDGPVVLADARVRLPGPVAVAIVWAKDQSADARCRSEFAARVRGLANDLQLRSTDDLLVITNLGAPAAERALADDPFAPCDHVAVLGARELSQILDRHAVLRSAMPSVLGLRGVEQLIPSDLRVRSSLDIERAHALACVFVPTRAYERARQVLARHRFVVLTGPPEMGKTAIAHMIALAQLTDGWEAHDCISPEQVWTALDRNRAQVFVADDAFGSTEYRPDAAEHWARELGRMLAALDERHWLIWTSRPAPLRSGLRRVQRERGSERFPEPGEVLVDASGLDLAEKTLILFRHVKVHGAGGATTDLVRSAGLSIVEHAHFTPERIRRFVAHRLDELVESTRSGRGPRERERAEVASAVERELATPTEEMVTSFRALEAEHRALLVALLDTPAGLTDERELAAAVRRHRPAGLSRPPCELIDRLTDHFLRISSLGIDWVHPSWRDLVIDELRDDPDARRRFLRVCGPFGALLALSQEGGVAGERELPLLLDDRDWDVFTDRVAELLRELEDHDLARLLLACARLLEGALDTGQPAEVLNLAEYVVGATRRSWDKQRRPIPVFLLQAWYELHGGLPEWLETPHLAATWAELHPGSLAFAGDPSELRRAEEWLALAETIRTYDPDALQAVGFADREAATLSALIDAAGELIGAPNSDVRSLAESLLARIQEMAPTYAMRVRAGDMISVPRPDERWWAPEDIAAPPSTELATPTPPSFKPRDVDRVLRDL